MAYLTSELARILRARIVDARNAESYALRCSVDSSIVRFTPSFNLGLLWFRPFLERVRSVDRLCYQRPYVT